MKKYTATVGEIRVVNTIQKIISYLEAKGYEADREFDNRLAHKFFQAADHWKRVGEGK